MTKAGTIAPATVEARAHPTTRIGVAFGRRFFVLLAAGVLWLGPAFLEPRFAYTMGAWDALLIIAWVLDAWRLPAPGLLTLRREWLGPAALSVASDVSLTLINASGRAIDAALADAVPRPLRSEPPSMRVAVGAGGEADVRYTIVPRERGEMHVGDIYVRYQSRLGIAERWARAPLAQTVVVYPNLEEARRESIHIVRNRQEAMERRSRRIRGEGRSFESLREHRDGDEFRDICWTASARRGRLVTRLYESERSQPIWIVIDAGRLMRAHVADVTKLDRAVNAALTLSRVAIGSGDRVGLLAYGRRIVHRLPAAHGRDHLRQIIERLAVVRAEESEADHLLAAGRLLRDQKRRGLIVWMTDVPDTVMTPEVVTAAAAPMVRHLVLFVVIGQLISSRCRRGSRARSATCSRRRRRRKWSIAVTCAGAPSCAGRARARSGLEALARSGERLPGRQAAEPAVAGRAGFEKSRAGYAAVSAFRRTFENSPEHRYTTSKTNSAAASPNFDEAARSVGDTKASIVPATTRIGRQPSTSLTASPPAPATASRRGSTPGNSSPCASRRPAPPAMMMAGSVRVAHEAPQRTPCRRARRSAPITPSRNPLKPIMYTVPAPAVMPAANVVSATLMLLVMIWLDAIGFMPTIECVHISRRSIVSSISGLSTFVLNSGSSRMRLAPPAADATKIRSEMRHGARLARKIRGYASKNVRTAAAGRCRSPE